MPREIVSHRTATPRSTIGLKQWVDAYFVRENYTNSRFALYERTGERNQEDYTYKVTSVGDDFREARIKHCHFTPTTAVVVLLGVPKLQVPDLDSYWLKQFDDQKFCSLRKGTSSEPAWCHCVHADYSRAGDFLFSATKPLENFEMQLGVAISVLETMRYYIAAIPEVKDLSMRIFNMPQVSDSMQKYIACIVLDKDYTSDELQIMVQTTIVRNRKWNADDLSSTAALLILLPMVRKLFREVKEPEARQSSVKQIHEDYTLKLESFDLRTKYHAETAELPEDGWTTERKAKAGARTINPKWIETVCGLAVNFGVSQARVDSFQQNLQGDNINTSGRLVVRFQLPTESIFWIRNTAADMRLVKVDQGVRAVGLSVHSKCYLTLCPDSRAVLKAYRVTLSPQCEGGGTFSVSSDNDRRARRDMLTTSPVSIEFDLRYNECVIRQGRSEFTMPCNRLNIQFSGGILTLTPTLTRKHVKVHESAGAEEVCGICLEDTKPSEIKHITDCNHTYHKPCIDKWIASCAEKLPFPTCPMCRQRI